jgi:RNA polymerase sigma-70 factor (ECF subfamily)
MNVHECSIGLTAGSRGAVSLRLPALPRARRRAAVPGTSVACGLVGVLLATARDPAASASPAWPAEHADREDIERCLKGDPDAYRRLVQRHQQQIANYLWRFTQDQAAREELTHDVFVEAYFALPGFKGRAPLLHWLRRIATRLGYRYWKQRQRRRRAMSLDELSEAAVTISTGRASAAETHELVHRLLECVSPRDRLVLTLAYLESLSIEEIAERTGWSRSMGKVQLHRARGRLARISRQMGVEW